MRDKAVCRAQGPSDGGWPIIFHPGIRQIQNSLQAPSYRIPSHSGQAYESGPIEQVSGGPSETLGQTRDARPDLVGTTLKIG